MLIRFKVGKNKYEVDEDDLTSGEAFLLKRDYGLTDFGDLSYRDPEVMLGLIVVAIRRKHTDLSEEDARTKAEGIKTAPIFEDLKKQFEKIIADAKAREAEDPPSPAENVSTAGETSGRAATRRKRAGAQS